VSGEPIISVVIPTFRRPDLLRRAVESVLAQRFQEWELIVSDDEAEPGEAWTSMANIASRDRRVRIVTNAGTHGQAGNTNNAMSLARGEWIKPLHDDDEMEADCLGAMLDAARRSDSAAIVQCLTRKIDDRGRRRDDTPGRRARIEEMTGRSACLSMYLQDLDIGVPTQMLVRTKYVHAGALFPTHRAITTAIDVLWYIDLLARGGLVLLNERLVVHRRDGHATATSELGEAGFFSECELLRDVLLPIVEQDHPPSVESVRQMLRLIRAGWNVHRGRVFRGLAIAVTCWNPFVWWLAARWAARRAFPGMFEAVPRRVLAR